MSIGYQVRNHGFFIPAVFISFLLGAGHDVWLSDSIRMVPHSFETSDRATDSRRTATGRQLSLRQFSTHNEQVEEGERLAHENV